jgi:hypothetical protein
MHAGVEGRPSRTRVWGLQWTVNGGSSRATMGVQFRAADPLVGVVEEAVEWCSEFSGGVVTDGV